MTTPVPREIFNVPAFAPLLRILDDVMLTGSEVETRWRYGGSSTLSNLRRLGKPPQYVKLPGGAIRYRVSAVLATEMAGAAGPLALEDVLLAISACTAISLEQRAKVIEFVRGAIKR